MLRRFSSLLSGRFGLNQDLIQIQDSALRFVKDYMDDQKADFWDKTDYFPLDVFKAAGEHGFAGVYCDQDLGGSGLGKYEATIIFEVLARGCMSTASYISIHNMTSWLIDIFGNKEQREEWMPKLNSFETLTSYCLTEPGSGSDAMGMVSFARKDGDDYILKGSKIFISGGQASDLFLIMAKTGERKISAFLLQKGEKGLVFDKKEDKLGWRSHPTQLITFDDIRIPKRNLLGQQGDGMKIAMKGLEGGRLTISSIALGGAWRALEKAAQYMQERKSFNTHLKDHQHLRFRMAQATARLTSGRMTIRQIAKLMDESDRSDKAVYSSIAKMISTVDCSYIVDQALQMFGGYGLLRSYGMERLYRQMRVLHIVEGTTEMMKHTIAKGVFTNQKDQNN